MFEPLVGDRVQGKVKSIVPHETLKGRNRILLDLGQPGWTCSLQTLPQMQRDIAHLTVGDLVDGWAIRCHREARFLAVSVSNMGRLPPTAADQRSYVISLRSVSATLAQAQRGLVPTPDMAAWGTVRHLVQSCVRKRDWDWLFVYKAFGFSEDSEARVVRGSYLRAQQRLRGALKGDAPQQELQSLATDLTADGFQALLVATAARMEDEYAEWESAKAPTPARQPRKSPASHGTPPAVGLNAANEHQELDDRCSLARSAQTQIRLERANATHEFLTRIATTMLRAAGRSPLFNGLIDLYCECEGRVYLFEMKSVTPSNIVAQVRKGLSQLYEYRYVHGFGDALLVLVLSAELTEEWLCDYLLQDRGVLVCWLSKGRFDCPPTARAPLEAVGLLQPRVGHGRTHFPGVANGA